MCCVICIILVIIACIALPAIMSATQDRSRRRQLTLLNVIAFNDEVIQEDDNIGVGAQLVRSS